MKEITLKEIENQIRQVFVNPIEGRADIDERLDKVFDLIKQSNIALLERIREEIVGEDEGDEIIPLTYDKALRNAFRAFQRLKLDEIRKEVI